MFAVARHPQNNVSIDLESVRDTLLYIESDLTRLPEFARLAGSIREALAEIARLEAEAVPFEKQPVTPAHFVPARF